MKQTPEQIKARLDAEAERQRKSEWGGKTWQPTISEQEREERAKQVANGILPF
jgi:hypothetical protein